MVQSLLGELLGGGMSHNAHRRACKSVRISCLAESLVEVSLKTWDQFERGLLLELMFSTCYSGLVEEGCKCILVNSMLTLHHAIVRKQFLFLIVVLTTGLFLLLKA